MEEGSDTQSCGVADEDELNVGVQIYFFGVWSVKVLFSFSRIMDISSLGLSAVASALDWSAAPSALVGEGNRVVAIGRAWREASPWGIREAGSPAPRELMAWIEGRLSGQSLDSSSVALADGQRWWAPAAMLVAEGVLVTLVEITGLQQAASELEGARAAAEAASRAKSQFLANMSHELRTPLNAILGFAELVRDGLTADPEGLATKLVDLACNVERIAAFFADGLLGMAEQDPKTLALVLVMRMREGLKERFREVLETGIIREYAEHGREIHAAGTHLLDLINDVLDFAKIEAGSMTLVEETFAVAPIVEAAVRLLGPKASEKRITLSVEADPSIRLYADRKSIRQMMLNLLSNAVKFTRPGGDVRAFVHGNSDGGCVIGVSDTGVGIPPEDQALVFRPFVQIASAGEAREGTGLGLPLVQRMAQLHGANVVLESELMRGTTVRIIWPPERRR